MTVTRRTTSSRTPRPERAGIALLDVLVASIVLSIALVSVLGLASRSLDAQIRGEQMQDASMVLDSLLNDVLALGPEAYTKSGKMQGNVDPPFDRYRYRIAVIHQGSYEPYKVTATVFWDTPGGEQSLDVETLMAPRLGDEPDPERTPPNPIDRN